MFNERDWSAFLSEELNSTVQVRFGRARQRVLEARHRSTGIGGTSVLNVRLSSFFANAPADVREAVAHWLRVGRRARKSAALLDAWVETTVAELPPVARRCLPIRPRGLHHDLPPIAAALTKDRQWLPPLEELPAVTWGRRTGVRARRSLQLGCYVAEENLVRMHPVLDQAWVPEWFVRYVLFHELLHAALPTERGSTGRAVHHGLEFKRWEQSYPDYSKAVTWLDRNLPKLFRSTRKIAKQKRPDSTAAREPARPKRAARSSVPSPSPGWLFPFLN